jgi:hypothetical protein
MLSTSDILEAYRADLSNAGKSRFSEGDGDWLTFGAMLQRAVSLPVGDRRACLETAGNSFADDADTEGLSDALAMLSRDGSSSEALCAAVMIVANEIEDAGAFALATAMLDLTRILAGVAEFRLQGRLLAQQARILRKIGETDLAHDLYDDVAEIGTTHGDQELIARAHLGKGVLARVRGNYPEARREFVAVLELAGSSGSMRELYVHAHHGLLVVSAIARDFDAALRHGAAAMAGATTAQHRVELLMNLASVCVDVGEFRSGLHSYLHVLAAARVQRVRLGAFGGAALAAARLGDALMVNALVEVAAPMLSHSGPEFELADMTREFAEAYAWLNDVERWRRYRDEALDRATRRGFFEIVRRIDAMSPPQGTSETSGAPRIALTRDALDVTARLASGDSRQLLSAAVSRYL